MNHHACPTSAFMPNVGVSGDGGGGKWRASPVPGLCDRSRGGAVRARDPAPVGAAGNGPRQDRRLHTPSSGIYTGIHTYAYILHKNSGFLPPLSSPFATGVSRAVPNEKFVASATVKARQRTAISCTVDLTIFSRYDKLFYVQQACKIWAR